MAYTSGRPATRRFGKFTGTLATGLLLVGGLFAASASPASAIPGVGVVCEGPMTMNYSPGLGIETQTTTFTGSGELSVCTAAAADQNIETAKITTSGTGNLSCVSGMATGTTTIQWNNDPLVSTFDFTNIVSLQPLGISVIALQGTVTAGWYEGAGVTQVMTMAPPLLDTLDCLGSGVTAVTGPVVVEFHYL